MPFGALYAALSLWRGAALKLAGRPETRRQVGYLADILAPAEGN